MSSTVADYICAAATGHTPGLLLSKEIEKLTNPKDINNCMCVSGSNTDTPLSLAARLGNFENVKFLLEKGADVNEKCSSTALIQAIWSRLSGPGIVKLLLDRGPDTTLEDQYRKDAMYYATTRNFQFNDQSSNETLRLLSEYIATNKQGGGKFRKYKVSRKVIRKSKKSKKTRRTKRV